MHETSLEPIAYSASTQVKEVVASLGRTEDVRVSPNHGRLALAGFKRSEIVVLRVEFVRSLEGPSVQLTRGLTLSSPALRNPHGVEFVDDDTLLVCSRTGDVSLFHIPPEDTTTVRLVQPIDVWHPPSSLACEAPSAASVTALGDNTYEVLVCDNDAQRVTRHLLEWGVTRRLLSSEVLLSRWMAVPDGVCVSANRDWLAVSNHGTNDVLLFSAAGLHEDSEPQGVLRGAHFPHGLHFADDDRYLLVADAGGPHLHVFASGKGGWHGVRYPTVSLRVMDDRVFERGRVSRGDGGPKGLDIAVEPGVVVTTCEHQPLAFYDVAKVLDIARGRVDCHLGHDQTLKYELGALHERRLTALEVKRAELRLREFKSRWLWRMTKPFRRFRKALARAMG